MIEPSLAKTRLGGVPPNILDCTEGLSPLAAIQPWPRTEYNYDIASDPIDKVIDPIGSLSYRYDPVSDVLMSIYDSATPAPLTPYTHFSYDGLNRLTQVTYPNGMICTYSYGTDFRLASISYTMNGQVIDNFAYSYDEVGNISRIDRTNWYVIYGYDLNNQLISADYEGSTDLSDEWYEYDPVGNRTASHLSSYYVYDELNRLLEDEQHWYEWDNNGNLTVKGNKVDGSFMLLGNDPENKLRRVEKSDGTVIIYAYDAKGRRVIRKVNGVEERFHYDGDDVLFDTDGSDDLTVRYVNLPGSVDQKVYATSLSDGQNYTYLRDHLGTIWKVLDSQGNVVMDYTYDSFGQVKGQAGTLPNRYTYTGREIEPESGLYYYRARFYDPEVGRFVGEEERITHDDYLLNTYVYVSNEPITSTDPYGLFSYNVPPPITVPVSPELEARVSCLESCLNLELVITGGAEKKGHNKGSKHYTGQAVDFSFGKNPTIATRKKEFFCCAKLCEFKYGKYEAKKPHYHLQVVPGMRGGNGDIP